MTMNGMEQGQVKPKVITFIRSIWHATVLLKEVKNLEQHRLMSRYAHMFRKEFLCCTTPLLHLSFLFNSYDVKRLNNDVTFRFRLQ